MGWGPTVKENDILAKLFEKVEVMGFLHPETPPLSSEKYSRQNIEFIPLPPGGGGGVINKTRLFYFGLIYFNAIWKSLKKYKKEDWIYVRSPCNIAFIALAILAIKKSPKRWVKYAGNWDSYKSEPISYRLQKWVLRKNFCRATVTVNGKWKDQGNHILSVVNPCIYEEEAKAASQKCQSKKITRPLKLLFVGRMEEQKGVRFIIELAKLLKKKNTVFEIHMVGEGPLYSEAKKISRELNIHLHGYLKQSEIHPLYSDAHIFLFPSTASEGWPKVISEAMAHKCVPIASRVSSIPQYLNGFNCGISQELNVKIWAQTILELMEDNDRWEKLGREGLDSIGQFTYEKFAKNIAKDIIKISGYA